MEISPNSSTDKDETIVLQEGPICLDDLTPYKGQWVFVKDQHVVDSDSDPMTLVERKAPGENDMLLIVPKIDSPLILH